MRGKIYRTSSVIISAEHQLSCYLIMLLPVSRLISFVGCGPVSRSSVEVKQVSVGAAKLSCSIARLGSDSSPRHWGAWNARQTCKLLRAASPHLRLDERDLDGTAPARYQFTSGHSRYTTKMDREANRRRGHRRLLSDGAAVAGCCGIVV